MEKEAKTSTGIFILADFDCEKHCIADAGGAVI